MKITLVPFAGLCNRLNAIGSALAYKDKHPETELTILWHKWFHCNCRFKDLFKPLPEPYPPVRELTFQLKDIPGNRLNAYFPQKLRHLWYDCSFLNHEKADDFDELTDGKERIYVNHENRFCKESMSRSLAKIFVPTDEIQKRIDSITSDWNKSKVVGLHIRRTDNSEAIKKSPIEHFYNVIEDEIKINPDVRFYVATDDESVKEDLKNKYGNRIITTELCLKRNSVKGMKDAVVDLFCLGLTSKIYGSAKSTYSIFASNLFNIELVI